MKKPDYIPADYKRIKVVSSLSELFSEQFGGPDDVNCILYPRSLCLEFNEKANQADFIGLSKALMAGESEDDPIFPRMRLLFLQTLSATNGVIYNAIKILRDDMKILKDHGYKCISLRSRSKNAGSAIEKFHYDGNDFSAEQAKRGRIICCYAGPVTEVVSNEDARMPRLTRPGEAIIPRNNDQIFSFKLYDVWRQNVRSRFHDDIASPFIHRAPKIEAGMVRLLLVAD